MRDIIHFMLILAVIGVSSWTDAASQDDSKDPYRLPSKIWENVNIMRKTDFKDKNKYIDIEEDVQLYLRYELGRIETVKARFSGTELYYLGLIHYEAGNMNPAINALETFLKDDPLSTMEPLTILKARTTLTEALTREGRLEEAEAYLKTLESEEAPLLDLLFLEIAKKFAAGGEEKKSLLYARKALSRADPKLSGFFLDHLVTHFLRAGMVGNSLLLIDEIRDSLKEPSDKALLEYLTVRRNQVRMIGEPAPDFTRSSLRWIGEDSPPTGERAKGKVRLVYFWATWCDPCTTFLSILNAFRNLYGAKGLEIVAITRLYGRGKLPGGSLQEDLGRAEEANLLSDFWKGLDVDFPLGIDMDQSLHRTLMVNEIPHLVVVDRKERIRLFISGGNIETDLLEGLIKELLEADSVQEGAGDSGDSVRLRWNPVKSRVRYTFGAKFEPPEGRILHGMGQFEEGNKAYLNMLGDPSIFPASSLAFISLGDLPRPWKYQMQHLAGFLAAESKGGAVPHVNLSLRGAKQGIGNGISDESFGVDREIAETTKLDGKIRDIVEAIANHGRPVFVRIGGEFNGPWNANHPYRFPEAFRKIVKMFRDRKVDHAAFVWCYMPAAPDDFDARSADGKYKWFPGPDVIDWFGIDLFAPEGFNARSRGGDASGSAFARTSRFLKMARAYRKPVMVAESSAALIRLSPDPGLADRFWNAWFKPYFDFLRQNDVVKAFHYINVDWSRMEEYRRAGWTEASIHINPNLAKLYISEIRKSIYLHRNEVSLLKDYEKYASPESR